MDFNNALIAGAGGLILGLVLGYAMGGGSGDEALRAQLAKADELAAKVDAMSGEVKGIGERIGGIEGVVTKLETAQGAALEGLGTRIDGIGQTVAGTVDKLGGDVSETLKSRFEGLSGQLDSMIAGTKNSAEGLVGRLTAATSGTAVTPGGTAVLAPGKLRVFLSSADQTAGTASVAINGQTLTALEVGKPVDAEGCEVELTGFDGTGAAMIDGGC